MTVTREMPRYVRHQHVWALKIKSVEFLEAEDAKAFAILHFHEEGYAPIEISQDLFCQTKIKPKPDQYYVVHQGGHRGFMPADILENSYTLYTTAGNADFAPFNNLSVPAGRDWKQIDAAIKKYLDDYVMGHDDFNYYYKPSASERLILDDAIAGLLTDNDFITLLDPAGPRTHYPYEQIDALASLQFTVAEAHPSLLSTHAVYAADGGSMLYHGRKPDCERVAGLLKGAFLDGGLYVNDLLATKNVAPVSSEPVGIVRASDKPGMPPYADIRTLLPGTKLYSGPHDSLYLHDLKNALVEILELRKQLNKSALVQAQGDTHG